MTVPAVPEVAGSATQWALTIVAASARAGRGEEDAAEAARIS